MGRQFQQAHDTKSFMSPEQLVFDRQQLEASTMFDRALQWEILGLFFVQLDHAILRLGQGSLSAEESKFMAHTLGGAAAAVGALEVKKLAVDWEKRLRDQNALSVQLAEATMKFKQSVKRYLPPAEFQ